LTLLSEKSKFVNAGARENIVYFSVPNGRISVLLLHRLNMMDLLTVEVITDGKALRPIWNMPGSYIPGASFAAAINPSEIDPVVTPCLIPVSLVYV
jgi:hypothetical protein